MTTAYVTMETGLDMKHTGSAGIVFQPLGTADFDQILTDAQELLTGMAEETESKIRSADDEFGYRWLILSDDDFDDIVVSLNTLSTELQGGGYGDRLLAAVFSFEQKGKRIYLIYNYKRGRVLPVRARPRRQAARQRVRAAHQGPAGQGGHPLGGRDGALVPAVGDPAVGQPQRIRMPVCPRRPR